MALLRVEELSKRFGKIIACEKVSFTLSANEIVGLVGENGAGKSTLVKLISGALRKDEGRILLEGEECDFNSPKDALERGISTVYQDFSLVETLSIKENIQLQTNSSESEIERMLGELGFSLSLNDEVDYVSENSKQKAEILKALLSNPKILLLDEPTHSLRKREIKSFFDYLRKAKERIGVLFISHKLREVKEIADRVLLMKEGRIFEVGVEDIEVPKPLALKRKGKEELLKVKFDGFSLSLREGEIVALINFPPRYKIRALSLLGKAEIVPEDRKEYLFMELSVKKNFAIGFKKIKGLLFSKVDEDALEAEIKGAIREYEIKAREEDLVETLSGGNQQKIMLSKALSRDLRVFIGYNLFSSLDYKSVEKVKRKLLKRAEEGIGIILFTEDLDEVKDIASRIFIHERGEVSCLA